MIEICLLNSKESQSIHVKYMVIECTWYYTFMFMICTCGKHHTTVYNLLRFYDHHMWTMSRQSI